MPLLPSLALLLLLAACGAGGPKTTPPISAGLPPELLVCRARLGDEHRSGEIALRTAQNLGTERLPDRTGRELHARLAPDGRRVAFVRQRDAGDATSRELFVAPLDDGAPELRLTADARPDEGPCWSPDGSTLLFATDAGNGFRLWRIGADGLGAGEFLAAAPGEQDREPDWHAATDRIVFARTGLDGRTRLWLVQGNGSGLVPLSPGPADRQPAWAPDGQRVAFVQGPAGANRLASIELATGTVTPLFTPMGEVALPRWSPHGDRIFLAIAEPLAGRPGLRLCQVRADGTGPVLLLPDHRWVCDGIDVLPALGPMPAAAAGVVLDPAGAQVQIAAGIPVLGSRTQLRLQDGQSLALLTQTFQGNEIAGVNLVFTLPVAAAGDVLAVRVRAVAALSRVDGSARLALALHNPVAGRFDTVTEVTPGGTAFRELAFASGSLAHVTQERQVRVEMIGEVGPGARAELHIDLVEVTVVARR